MPSVSISVVMASVIAVSATLAALVAFVPTYTRGVQSTKDIVKSLRENIIGRVDHGVSNFFKGRALAVDTVSAVARAGMDITAARDTEVVGMLCDEVYSHRGATQASLFSPTHAWFCADDLGPDPVGSFYNGTHLVLYHYDRPARNWSYALNPITNQLEPIPWIIPAFDSFKPNENFLKLYSNPEYRQPGRHWTEAQGGFDSAHYEAFAMFHITPSKPAIMTIGVLTRSITAHFTQLLLPRRARALAVDGTNGLLVGNSWNATMHQALDLMNFSAPEHERIKLFTLSDMNDTLVTQAVAHIGGEQAFYDIKTNYSSVMGSGKDRVFVDVFRVSDTAGLDMAVLLVMPEIDFLEDTYAMRDKTIGGIAGALAILILLAIVFSILIARPLHRLGDRMYKTASLQDDDADDAPSILSEVRSMQEAYTTMKQELNRMKSYLPQSVLCAMYDEEEDEEETESEAMTKSVLSGRSGLSSGSPPTQSGPPSDTQSRSSRSSFVPAERKSSAGVIHLNTAKSVVSKRVVVMAFNLCGFQKRLEGGRGAKDLPELQARFLTLVNKHVRENKGVVDTFQGDHILASFNAVSNVVSAPKRAALAAMHACQEAAKDPELPPVSVGISAGVAFVGNMGNSDMQRFNIVGPVYVEALMMERLAREQLASSSNSSTATTKPWRILGLGNIIQDISLEFYFQCVDFVAVPSNPGKPQIAIALEQLKTVTSGEWMYMLEEGANADPFVDINEACYLLLKQCDVVAAKAKLDSVKHPEQLLGYHRLHGLFIALTEVSGDEERVVEVLCSLMTYVSFASH